MSGHVYKTIDFPNISERGHENTLFSYKTFPGKKMLPDQAWRSLARNTNKVILPKLFLYYESQHNTFVNQCYYCSFGFSDINVQVFVWILYRNWIYRFWNLKHALYDIY